MDTQAGGTVVSMYMGQHTKWKDKQIQTGLCVLGETPILSQVLRKGFLEVDKLKRMLSVRMEEVIRYLRGCLEEETSSG